jgi:hypothetical protein
MVEDGERSEGIERRGDGGKVGLSGEVYDDEKL